MICAEDELGLGESHDGIMVLPAEARVGMPAAELLNIETDYVFEIGLTPNRTDAMGHIGVARDLAARLSLKKPITVHVPKAPLKHGEPDAAPVVRVMIDDDEGCGRYAGLYLENVKVEPSPVWLQNFLRSTGHTPKNNVVDITNFVMLETGQPLHAFDGASIKGGEIRVRTLPAGSVFTTLDGVERKLDARDLMICDAEGGLCIAGVLGGENSGVHEETTTVFLESAWFNPVRVRKTAKRHGLNTDASFRFERGVDHRNTVYALERAASLIEEMAGGKIRGPLIDIVGKLPQDQRIDFSVERFNALAGTAVDVETVRNILESLDFRIVSENGDELTLDVPAYRVDVTREVDVVEEVLRIYGYNAVESPAQMRVSLTPASKPTRTEVMRSLRQILMGRGFNEMISNGLTRSDALKTIGGESPDKKLIHLLNPLSQELDVLRPSLVVSALEAVAYNVNRQAERLRLFEFGKAYTREDNAYRESTHLAITLLGNRFEERWNNPVTPADFSVLRGNVEAFFSVLGLSSGLGQPVKNPFFAEAVEVLLDKERVGHLGRIDPAAARVYGVKREVWIAEIDFDRCFEKVKHAGVTVRDLPKFPSVQRDFSLLLDKQVTFAEIEAIAFARGGRYLREVDLFDVYEGKNLPEGKKSYAVRFVLQDDNKTLNDKQIDKSMAAIQAELESALGAQLR